MQMRHGLAAVRAVVDDQPVAAFQSSFFAISAALSSKWAEQFMVVRCGLGNARNQLPSGKIKCASAPGIDVAGWQGQIVLVNDVRRGFRARTIFSKSVLLISLSLFRRDEIPRVPIPGQVWDSWNSVPQQIVIPPPARIVMLRSRQAFRANTRPIWSCNLSHRWPNGARRPTA